MCNPGTRTVRYVGKSDNPKKRLVDHLASSKRGSQTYVSRWLRGLDDKPALFILGEIPIADWEGYEKNAIAAARALGMNLTNLTDGGEGVSNPSLETRKKISDANRGEKHPLFGKKHTQETRVRMAKAHAGRKQKNNTSGFTGVYKTAGKWASTASGIYLGLFLKIEDAVFARALAIATL